MRDDRLVGIDEAAGMLALPRGAVRRILAANGLRPVDFGRGRGLGLRWRRSDILAVMDRLVAEANPERHPLPPRRTSPPAGLSTAEIMAAVFGTPPMQ